MERETAAIAVVSTEPESFRYVIARNRLPELRENLKRINRRAARYGVAPFTVELGRRGQEFVENRSEGFAAHIDTIEVTVTGQRFALGEYRVMAAIDHKTPLFRAFGDFRIPGKYLNGCAECEHCNSKRARNKTFLLADASGTLKQVGSSCIEEFTGISVGHALAATSVYDEFAAMQKEMEGDEGRPWGTLFEPCKPTVPFLAIVARQIREDGWVSSSQANANREMGVQPSESTSRSALDELKKLIEKSPLGGDVSPNVEPQDMDVATQALAHARESYADVPQRAGVEEFDANMWAASAGDMFLDRHAGLTAFVVRKYYSEVLDPRRERALSASSGYVGTPKVREDFAVVVYKKIPIQDPYGQKTLCLMHDADGNQFRWMASGATGLEAGKAYIVKATVKKHDEYNGAKQTHLLRVSVVEELDRLATPEAHRAVETDDQPAFEA
ncbi:hypothetical protein R70006_06263 [Paraburkholderia domus]|uniref:hypothetical protein n=1 Tax=Paraburkholderia domus TaxID=2793075 RepID=UPI001912018C|nr:hypothetical protein [Paraburkholderia domus]MBK5052894.1 hypothetical protein [Burkholderia sp. R-70006]CAE6822356.1 hypothetical protein R70006_06263 [Paraburkholderia domus]